MLKVTVFVPVVAEVVLEEQEPPKVTVPASEDVIIKSGVLSFVGVGIVLPSTTGAVVSVVVLSLVVDAPSSLLLLQEMTVRLKRNREKMMSICLTRFPIRCFRRILNITSIGLNYKNVGRLWRLSDSVKN